MSQETNQPLEKIQEAFGVKNVIKRWSKVAAPCASTVGFVTDVLTPLGSILKIILYISIAVTVVSGIIWFVIKRNKLKEAMKDGKCDAQELEDLAEKNGWSIAFAFGAFNTVILTLFLGTQNAMGSPEHGIIADTIPAVAAIQSSLLRMEVDLKNIDNRTQDIQRSITKIDSKLDGIGKNGGLIEEPSKAEDFLHNADIYYTRSDFASARLAYQKYFELSGHEFVDIHLAYADLLKFQEGIEGARRHYRQSRIEKDIPPRIFALATLEEREKRVEMLTELTEKHPDFSPAWLQLSKDHSELTLGSQTVSDKRKEKMYLEKFVKLHEEGKFSAWYLNKEKAQGMVDESQDRYTRLSKESFGIENPVTFTAMKSNQGWSIYLTVNEFAEEVWFKLEGQEFKSTGFTARRDPASGKTVPEANVGLGDVKKKTKFQIKYKNQEGVEQGPYELEFNPQDSILAQAKSQISMIKQWFTVENYQGSRTTLFFTALSSTSSAIKEVRYHCDEEEEFSRVLSVNGKELDIQRFMIEVPVGTKHVSAHIHFMDDSVSDVLESKTTFRQ